ncbi:MAG: glycoside hydrolase family 65 protein, partial [Oscillospiraceae bacterium]|nr:glycoside hydrolase family 65 protein [Oscillospiraceae bacterium]
MLPVFLYTEPELAKKLLQSRFFILPKARERARVMGHPIGALFPWRTIDGEECSAYFPAGTAQVHIDGDIAHAVWEY